MQCPECGTAFVPYKQGSRVPRKYCSSECAKIAGPRTHQVSISEGRARVAGRKLTPRGLCLYCGQPVQSLNAQYCSHQCAMKARILINDVICKHCGVTFKPKKSAETTFCSRECAFAYKRANAQPDPEPKICLICGKQTPSRREAYCSSECRKEQARRDARALSVSKKVLRERACKECGTLFTPEYGNKRRAFCSVECSHKYGSRVGKGTRRARIHSVIYESVDPIKVFKRDGWRCHICGDIAPQQLRGTYDDLAPELDHIKPVSKGGAHTYANTACAHRKCNQDKSDRVYGQLSLLRAG